MSTAPTPATPPAGWYQDPHGAGLRYWDGADWTDQTAATPPAAPAAAPERPQAPRPAYGAYGSSYAITAPAFAPVPQQRREASTGDWVGGVLLAVILPILGLVAGAVYVAKNDHRKTVGYVTLGLSALMIVLWGLIQMAASAAP